MKRLLSICFIFLLLTPTLFGQFWGYFYVERLNLTDAQTATLIDGLKTLGRSPDDPCPCKRNHWRIRLDNNAAIFEADWDNATISAEAVKTRLATLFGINPSLITYTTSQTAYGPVMTYTVSSTNRVRFGVFGGQSATWRESWQAVTQYLRDNLAAWEP